MIKLLQIIAFLAAIAIIAATAIACYTLGQFLAALMRLAL